MFLNSYKRWFIAIALLCILIASLGTPFILDQSVINSLWSKESTNPKTSPLIKTGLKLLEERGKNLKVVTKKSPQKNAPILAIKPVPVKKVDKPKQIKKEVVKQDKKEIVETYTEDISWAKITTTLKENIREITLELKQRIDLTSSPKHLLLENPPRLVIDLTGTIIREGKKNEKTKNPLFSTVRLGVHKDKSRIVFDLKESCSVNSFTNTSGKGIKAILSCK